MSIYRFRLQSMQNAQCHVVIETYNDGGIKSATLVSYNTVVLKIYTQNGYAVMDCSGVYSVTTARHINRFTTEFCGRNMYYVCKDFVTHRNKYPNGNIALSVADFDNFVAQSYRYLNNAFSQNVRKYFGKY